MLINAKVSILAFITSWTWFYFLWYMDDDNSFMAVPIIAWSVCMHYLLLFTTMKNFLDVSCRSYFLGLVFSAGVAVSLEFPEEYLPAGLYLIVLSIFHFGEYLATALFNPSELKLDAFMLNHSKEYNIALLCSWIEYAVWMEFYSESSELQIIALIGFFGCVAGDTFRKLAMYTAGKSFNHIIQHRKQDGHVFVSNGVYAVVRHPAYTGWFCWSVSTQILLCNPICFVAYGLASWKFFKDRIEYEELTLLHFFGTEYADYKNKVASGIPFVYGCEFKLDQDETTEPKNSMARI